MGSAASHTRCNCTGPCLTKKKGLQKGKVQRETVEEHISGKQYLLCCTFLVTPDVWDGTKEKGGEKKREKKKSQSYFRVEAYRHFPDLLNHGGKKKGVTWEGTERYRISHGCSLRRPKSGIGIQEKVTCRPPVGGR